MKYVIVLADGMADEKIEAIGNKTPLQVANIPTINDLAKHGEIGLVKSIPEGMLPGSDVANLSVMGYDPLKYHTGRSPLEAVSMGLDIKETDVTFRCNLVTISEEEAYDDKSMLDHGADEITSEEAKVLIEYINEALHTEDINFFPGVSYRHAIVWSNGPIEFTLIPPHDILTKKIKDYLPKGEKSDILYQMMKKSYDLLKNHPINLARVAKGLKPANSIWIWGEGKKPQLDSFKEKFGIDGSVISAVDLVKGIGMCAGLDSIDVEGATGNIHTNFDGKAIAAVEELKKGKEFIYIHVEAPDECGHQGDLEGKIKSIELIDEKIVKVVKDYLESTKEDYKMMIVPDHPTPIATRTHTSNPVPYVIYDSRKETYNETNRFDEDLAEASGNYFDSGDSLANYFVKN